MTQELLDAELKALKRDFESGDVQAITLAFMLCAQNRLTFPGWLYHAVIEEMEFAYENKQRGGRMRRRASVEDSHEAKHRIRHALVHNELEMQRLELADGNRQAISEAEASRAVETKLKELRHPFRGSADAILQSYRFKEGRVKKL